MSDLDVIREARDYLAGLVKKSDVLNPASWAVEAGPEGSAIVGFTKKPITWDDHGGEVFEDSTARLIVALRAAAPYLLVELREAERYVTAVQDGAANNSRDWALDIIALARAILATKGEGR